MKHLKTYFFPIVAVIAVFLLVHQCSKGHKEIIKTKTVTETKIVHDTIVKTEIKKEKMPVYVERLKTVKGKDSIVYREIPTETTEEANIYMTTLKSNKATAELNITALGDVLDVKGVITYPEVTKTITNDIYHQKGGLFLYGAANMDKSPDVFEVGLDWSIKNKWMVGVGVNYNDISNDMNVMFKVGIKIF